MSAASACAKLFETAIDVARPNGGWRRCIRVGLLILNPRRGKAEMSNRRRDRRFHGLCAPRRACGSWVHTAHLTLVRVTLGPLPKMDRANGDDPQPSLCKGCAPSPHRAQ